MKKSNWILIVFVLTFILSIIFSAGTNFISVHSGLVITTIIILIVIAIGIIFDMIGAASLTANEKTFHAMSAQKVKGAKTANYLVKNNVKVSSICNDIVGDICGIVSGGLGAVLALELANKLSINVTIMTMIVAAIISALTVGGKAIFKSIAIKNSEKIVFTVSKLLSILKKNK